MRIVIDANIPLGQEFFSTVGEVVAVPPREIAREHLLHADALIVRSVKKINRELLQDTPLQFVGTCTAGFDHLDVKAIEDLNIYWCNAPGCNANSVVEYVVCALSALKANWLQAKVGIVGCGQVGGRLHQRLRQLNIKCVCYDPFLSASCNSDLVDFEHIFHCDIICIHTPYTLDGAYPSHYLFNENNMHRLNAGVVLINAGRGGVIDNQALLNLLNQRDDLRVVLDVWENEPAVSADLLNLVDIGTPHIAGHSLDGKINGTAMIYDSFCRYFELKPKISLSGLDKPPKPQAIIVDTTRIEDAIGQAASAAFDIQTDYQRWQSEIKRTNNIAQSFDDIRKNYPARREFFHYPVIVNNKNKTITAALRTLGFQVL
jgi:erythronate-4-phosphate dehydrogenase